MSLDLLKIFGTSLTHHCVKLIRLIIRRIITLLIMAVSRRFTVSSGLIPLSMGGCTACLARIMTQRIIISGITRIIITTAQMPIQKACSLPSDFKGNNA
jgi:hypothetical protein